jgi:hypothetical protein
MYIKIKYINNLDMEPITITITTITTTTTITIIKLYMLK